MAYTFELRASVEKEFHKIAKKNPPLLIAIHNKIEEILQNPLHYKPLRAPYQHMRRVHIMKSFVLIFSINALTNTVIIESFEHHDAAYL